MILRSVWPVVLIHHFKRQTKHLDAARLAIEGSGQSHAKLHAKAEGTMFPIDAGKMWMLFHKQLLQFVC